MLIFLGRYSFPLYTIFYEGFFFIILFCFSLFSSLLFRSFRSFSVSLSSFLFYRSLFLLFPFPFMIFSIPWWVSVCLFLFFVSCLFVSCLHYFLASPSSSLALNSQSIFSTRSLKVQCLPVSTFSISFLLYFLIFFFLHLQTIRSLILLPFFPSIVFIILVFLFHVSTFTITILSYCSRVFLTFFPPIYLSLPVFILLYSLLFHPLCCHKFHHSCELTDHSI